MINQDAVTVFIVLYSFLHIISIYSFIKGIAEWQTSWNAVKTRSKGQTFKEKITFARFREEIPEVWIKYYYYVSFFNLSLASIYALLYYLNVLEKIRIFALVLLVLLWLTRYYIEGIKFENTKRWSKPKYEKYIPRMKQKGGRNRKQYNNKK